MLTIDGVTVSSFDATSADPVRPNGVSYTKGNRDFAFGCDPDFGQLQRYAVLIADATNTDETTASGNGAEGRILVGGLRTDAGTVVASRTYATAFSSFGFLVGTAAKRQAEVGSASILTFDAAARTLMGTATIAADGGQPAITVTLNAVRVSGSSLISGTVTSPGGGTGQITGGFFGPAGNEVAFTFTLDRGADRFAGYVFGH